MPRYKLTIEYDGTCFAGWQKVPDRPTIQGALEQALHAFCGEEVSVNGSGRTDAGVHATGQVAHIDLQKPTDTYQIMSGINYHLLSVAGEKIPTSNSDFERRMIAVLSAEEVADDFEARFSATKRHYTYRILSRRPPPTLNATRVWHVIEELDAEAMQLAADRLIGHHDFSSFRDSQCQAKSPEKTLDYLKVEPHGSEILIYASARSFLHHQVRNITGTLKMVGAGKWTPDDMTRILEAKDRREAGPTAPPQGLTLTKVEYEE